MCAPSALAALLSVLSFFFSESDESGLKILLSRLFAVLTVFVAATYFCDPEFHLASRIDGILMVDQPVSPWPRVPIAVGVAYVILAVIMTRAARSSPSACSSSIWTI
jgi:hypothetical protein